MLVKRICNIISTIIIIGLAAIAILLLAPKLLGYESMVVVSGSMEPEIHVGSMVYVKEADPTTLKEGDIITYHISSDTVVTHRIAAVNAEQQEFVTKGDANNTEDANPVKYENVIGKTEKTIPYVGYISMYLKTPLGIAAACGVIFIMIILMVLPELFSKKKEKNTEKKA